MTTEYGSERGEDRGIMNYFIDIHANILPDMPGLGHRPLTAAEAADRIRDFQENNIKVAAAAPYFDPETASPEEFLAQRNERIAALTETAAPMRIIGGAVLPFAYCLAHPRELQALALGTTGYILVDLPEERVSQSLCDDISRLRITSGLCPIAADIDRKYALWSPEDWITLRRTGMLLQVSVRGLMQQEHRKLSLYLLANQYAHFVATGAQNPEEPLHFTETMRLIQRSLPAQLYRRIKNNPGMLLSNAEPSSFLS